MNGRRCFEPMACNFPLQALRIPAGWLVEYNAFCEMPLDHPLAWSFACKDTLLMLRHPRRDVLVDLSWMPPEEPDGHYLLRVLEGDHCGRELHAFESRDRVAVVAELERLLDDIAGFRFPATTEGTA